MAADGEGPTTAGLVDLQVNGFAGIDFNDAGIDAAALNHALEAMLATGVTCCLPTLITAPLDILAARFAALDRAVAASELGPLMVPGYHLEGPFLNAGDGFAGCHPPAAMTDPMPDAIDRIEAELARPILMTTLAPERAGALDAIRALAGRGLIVGLGHTAADHATVVAAADAGAAVSTHLGNGLPQTLPKFDNPLLAQLAETRLAPSFIADGLHIPPWVLKLLVGTVGLGRAILITDATAAAGVGPGTYPFAGTTITRDTDGRVSQPGSAYLAGSGLILDEAVRNIVAWGIADWEGAIRMASANPRRLLARAAAARGAAHSVGTVRWDAAGRVRTVGIGTELMRSY